MGAPIITAKKYHGVADLGLSRYITLYVTQLGWVMLGVYLLRHAYWPSSCRPDTISEIYLCSVRLADNRGVIETALMTWLWSTPLLLLLDVSRRYRAWVEKRSK